MKEEENATKEAFNGTAFAQFLFLLLSPAFLCPASQDDPSYIQSAFLPTFRFWRNGLVVSPFRF